MLSSSTITLTTPKPGQWSAQYAQIFKDQSVVDAYRFRPAYVSETFDILDELLRDFEPGRVLDAGCGTGNLARELINLDDVVDAVDFSAAAIDAGRRLPGGDSPRLRWLCSPMETADLTPPYALITAGASLHWMDWDIVLPLFGRLLQPGAVLALVENVIHPPPWSDELRPLIGRYSMNKEFQPYDNRTLVADLQQRRLFQARGERQTKTIELNQSVEAYVNSFHSRNGLSRDRMASEMSQEFDRRLTALVSSHCPSGTMTLHYHSRVIWGHPMTAES